MPLLAECAYGCGVTAVGTDIQVYTLTAMDKLLQLSMDHWALLRTRLQDCLDISSWTYPVDDAPNNEGSTL